MFASGVAGMGKCDFGHNLVPLSHDDSAVSTVWISFISSSQVAVGITMA